MGHWVAAFVGDGARENFGLTKDTGAFFVSSNRTPVKKARSGDSILLYLAGEGFVGQAILLSGAHAPYGEPRWSGKSPVYGISLEHLQTFDRPLAYKFEKDGTNQALGLHRYALVGGFAGISEEGFRDVLRRAGLEDDASQEPGESQNPAPTSPRTMQKDVESPNTEPEPPARPTVDGKFEKRLAGQHASREGRKRAALWTVAEIGASTFGLKNAERFAQGKVGEAEKTWIAGGRGEQNVGAVLDGLCQHGFYLFHDVKLPNFGNVDHVALGPRGFFAIETKSHKGKVSGRGRNLLLNGHKPEKDFVDQAWSGCYRLKEILSADITPVLCFSEAFVEGRVFVRGVPVVPLRWLEGEILRPEPRYGAREVATAVNVLGTATGCYPSAVPGVARKKS